MPRVRQLPEIYLRGALANETMKNLNHRQKQEVEKITDKMSKHPVLAGHKNEFMHQLGVTIACDYDIRAGGRETSEQEYKVAIWRATVYLLYHHSYSYQCSHCNAHSYFGQRGKEIKMNRRYLICPNCRHCTIDEPNDAGFETGDAINHDDLLVLISDMQAVGEIPPTTKTCILPIKGEQAIKDPSTILNDKDQIYKFYGEFIWNYFRQILLENHITKHKMRPTEVHGAADAVVATTIMHHLDEHKIEHVHQTDQNGAHRIACAPYSAPPEFTIQVSDLLAKAKQIDVGVQFLPTEIVISPSNAVLEHTVKVAEQVCVMAGAATKDDDDNGATFADLIHDPNTNAHDENSIPVFESSDTLNSIRDQLPDRSRLVFDLLTNQGDTYEEFVERYPESINTNYGVPRQNRMAEFLGCAPKDIKTDFESIKTLMLVHGIC